MRTGEIRRGVRSALARLSDADLDPTVYRHEALTLLRRAVGFDAWCWTLVDPGSGLPTHAIADNPAVARNPARFHQLVYGDVAGLGRSDAPNADGAVSVFSQSTGGGLDSNAPWREVLGPAGLGDGLDAALVAGRLCWGHLSLYRGADCCWFTESDRAFIADITPTFAYDLRRSIRTVAVCDTPDDSDVPGILVLDPHLRVLAITREARRWLMEIDPAPTVVADRLPGFVYALGARVGSEENGHPERSRVRVRTPGGQWLVLWGAALSSAGSAVPAGSIAITIEPARSGEIAPLLMQAWGLSRREREVASLVLDGLDTDEIAAELFISPHTVRDHVRSALDKVGVRSRRHLVSALTAGSSHGPDPAPGGWSRRRGRSR